jgi:ADP-heptose:LPS heptosyltransferase
VFTVYDVGDKLTTSKVRQKIEGLVNSIRDYCFEVFDAIYFRFEGKAVEKSSCKILFVRLDAIGDFILWVDAARSLREIYPRGRFHLTLLGNSLWATLARDLDIFDEVWSLDRRQFSKKILYRIALLKKIKLQGFEMAIQPSYSRDLMFGDSVIRASTAKVRIGSIGDCSNISSRRKRKSDQWYSKLLPATSEPITELERNAEFLRGLGLPGFKSSVPELPVVVPSPVSLASYYILFPGAGATQRQWPVANFARLAEKIYQATGWTGVICGGPGEAKLGETLMDIAAAPLENWAGKTSLQELIAIIARANLLLSNETSAVHIAAGVSTPCVCLLGGGHYGRFLPYRTEQETIRPLPVICAFQMECFGCNWDCPYCTAVEVAPCIAQISVDMVWTAVKGLLPGNKEACNSIINRVLSSQVQT